MAGMLHLVGGKIGAGKSTLCARLAQAARGGGRPAVLISEDAWNKALFGEEMREIADYARVSAKLRAAMGPHVGSLLEAGVEVVLDFANNRETTRAFWKEVAEAAGAKLLLHWLETPEEICRERLHRRNEEGIHEFAGVDDATFDLVNSYVQPPRPEEGLEVVRVAASG